MSNRCAHWFYCQNELKEPSHINYGYYCYSCFQSKIQHITGDMKKWMELYKEEIKNDFSFSFQFGCHVCKNVFNRNSGRYLCQNCDMYYCSRCSDFQYTENGPMDVCSKCYKPIEPYIDFEDITEISI